LENVPVSTGSANHRYREASRRSAACYVFHLANIGPRSAWISGDAMRYPCLSPEIHAANSCKQQCDVNRNRYFLLFDIHIADSGRDGGGCVSTRRR
jgi:hypothetical protein